MNKGTQVGMMRYAPPRVDGNHILLYGQMRYHNHLIVEKIRLNRLPWAYHLTPMGEDEPVQKVYKIKSTVGEEDVIDLALDEAMAKARTQLRISNWGTSSQTRDVWSLLLKNHMPVATPLMTMTRYDATKKGQKQTMERSYSIAM